MNENRKTFYWIAGIILAAAALFFSQKTGDTLEEKDYIMALGFDLSQEGITVSYESPVLKKDEADSVLDNPQTIEKLNVTHFKDFVEKYNSENDKELDLHHLKVILIGSNLLANEEQFQFFLKFLQEQNEFAENIFVAVDSSGGELFKEEEESVGNYLETLIEKKTEEQPQMSVTVGRLLSSVYNKNQTIFIPTVSNERKIIGEWAIACGKPVSFINEEDAQWYMTGNCIDCGCEIYFQDVYSETIEEKQNFSIEISKISRQIVFNQIGDIVNAQMLIKIKGRGRDCSGDFISDAAERYDKEELLGMCLTKKMQELAKFSSGKDLFNTYYELSNKSRSLWKKYQDSYDEYVSNLDLEITVSVDFTD